MHAWRLTPLLLAVAVLMAALQLWIWAGGVAGMGGLDAHVKRNTDFLHLLTGALILRDGDGAALYDLNVQRAAQNRVLVPYGPLGEGRLLPYNHPPLEALVLAPLLDLHYVAVYVLWCLASLAAALLALHLVLRELGVPRTARWLLLAATCAYHPVHRTLWLGQNSLFVLAALAATFLALRRGREYSAGLCLVVVALLKPQVLPAFLLLLLFQRRWRIFAGCAAGLALFTLATMPILGVLWPLRFLELLAVVATWQRDDIINPAAMHNWRGLLTNLLYGRMSGLIVPLTLAFMIATFGLLIYAWWVARDREGEPNALLWALAGIVAILTAIHLLPHDLTLLLLPIWLVGGLLATRPIPPRSRLPWLLAIGVSYALGFLIFLTPALLGAVIVLDVLAIAVAGAWLVWAGRHGLLAQGSTRLAG